MNIDVPGLSSGFLEVLKKKTKFWEWDLGFWNGGKWEGRRLENEGLQGAMRLQGESIKSELCAAQHRQHRDQVQELGFEEFLSVEP